MLRFTPLCLALILGVGSASAQTSGEPQIAFDRIVHGWTNYSTAFNATHDTGVDADYATIATPFTPEADAVPQDYGVIVIGGDTRPPDFSRFQFRVMVWSGLEAFIQEPRQGDVATWNFTTPTGGSTSIPDTTTRGGRPAFELRFSLTNSPIVLSNGQPSIIGFAARADTRTAGELFVPTSSQFGTSDLQAGDLVVGGWRYVVTGGGSTVYSGRLAVRLEVLSQVPRPRLDIARSGNALRLSWPVTADDFVLETTLGLTADAFWFPVDSEPFEVNGQLHVTVPMSFGRQWFRLHR